MSAPPAPGIPQVAGYEILKELGRGAMGVVYKARHLRLKRLVALKMILHGDHAHGAQKQRFRAEAEAVARLHHPNIVQVYEIGKDHGRPSFSLEFVDGGSLDARLEGTPLPARTAAVLVEAVSRGMDAAHQRGIVHRDLKPANILIADCGLQIADSSDQSAICNPQFPRSPTSVWPSNSTTRRRRRAPAPFSASPLTWLPNRPRAGRATLARSPTSTHSVRFSTSASPADRLSRGPR